jgi:hypothetical protein
MSYLAERPPIKASVAGFVVWLTHQSGWVPAHRRAAAAIGRFLEWQREQCGASNTEDAYCCALRRQGVDRAEVNRVRAAIGMFRRYLRAVD